MRADNGWLTDFHRPSKNRGLKTAEARGAGRSRMPGTRSILPGVVIGALFLGALLWTLWSGDRPPLGEPPSGAVSERDVLERRSGQKTEAVDVDEDKTSPNAAAPPRGALRGTVVLDDTTAAVEASVVAIVPGTWRYAGKTLTDQGGHYTLRGLEAGTYRVTAWRGIWTHRSIEREEYDVFSGTTTDVDEITLVSGNIVRGQVVEEGNGKPLEGIRVSSSGLHTFTGAQGQFVLNGVSARSGVTLVARGKRHSAKLIYVHTASGELPYVKIELARGGVIHGTVTDHEGKPAEGVTVSADAGNVDNREKTDAAGRYRLEGIPLNACGVNVVAWCKGRFETRGTVPGFSPGTNEFRLDLQLAEGFALSGRVMDQRGMPVAGAKLYTDWSPSEILAHTGADGSFTIDGATDRMDLLTARKEGYAPASLDLQRPEADARERIELVLLEGKTVSGRVIDEQGAPVAEALVHIRTETRHTGPQFHTLCDEVGRFLFEDLPARLEEAIALKDGYVDSRGNPVTVGDHNLEIVLEQAGAIEGFVVDAATGAPVFPTTVKITYSEDPRHRSSRRGGLWSLLGREGIQFTREDGSFRLTDGLTRDGHYKLIVLAEDYAEAILPDVAAWPASAEREPIQVLLERGAAVAGDVVSAVSGQRLEDVTIHHIPSDQRSTPYWREVLRGEGRAIRTTVSDGNGHFELVGIRPAPGVLLLEKPGYARTGIEGVVPSRIPRFIELADEAVLEGTVTDVYGEGQSGVYISVEIDGQTFSGGTTDPRGEYRVSAMPAGVAIVNIWGRNSLERTETTTLMPGQVTVLDISSSGGSIAGAVTMGGQPVPGASVRVRSVDDTTLQQHVRTDSQGTFRSPLSKPGTYELTARRPGGRRSFRDGKVATVEVSSGEVTCHIELPAGRVTGTVFEAGRPVEGAYVTLARKTDREPLKGLRFSGDGGWIPYDGLVVAAHGGFEFDCLDAGLYLVTVARTRSQPIVAWAGPFELSLDSAVQGVVVDVSGERQLSVRATDEGTAEPIENAWASLEPLEQSGVQIAGQRSSTSAIEFSGVPAGRYRLCVEGEEHMAYYRNVDLSTTDAELVSRLEPATWIVLELVGPTDSNGRLRVVATMLAGGDPGWRSTSPDGVRPKAVASYDPTSTNEPSVRIKTRPGEYHMRFEILPARDGPQTTALVDDERWVIVPENGEVSIRYAIPGM